MANRARTVPLLAVAAILSCTALPARADQRCLAQYKQQAARANLQVDDEIDWWSTFSAERKRLMPLHAALKSCLGRAYQKTVRITRGTPPSGPTWGFASKTDAGIDSCELVDIDRLGGYGPHQTDFILTVKCYHLNNTGAANDSGSSISIERELQPAFGALGAFFKELGKVGQ